MYCLSDVQGETLGVLLQLVFEHKILVPTVSIFLSQRTARDFGLRSVATSAGLPSSNSYRLRFGVCMWYKPPQLVNCGLLQSV